jgi:bile acid:Na+ symporter, BASS family
VTLERLRVVERNLVPLVVATAAVGLAFPAAGVALTGAIGPLLALLLLCVSATFDAAALRVVLRRPGVQVLATALVYGPMALLALALGAGLYGLGTAFGLGLVLVGVLPTDVSSPLLVWIAKGDVALATVLNAVNTALAPVLVPVLFLALTGVELDVPLGPLVAELALVVLVPTAAGVALRTARPAQLAAGEPVLSAVASLAYLALLLAVVGPSAGAVLDAPVAVVGLAGAALVLHLAGYAVATAAFPLVRDPGARTALRFTVAKKEFSIAALLVAATGLPAEVALPAAVYAVVQMLVAPIVARRVAPG